SVRNLGTVVPNDLRVGHGVKTVGIEKMHSQGSPTQTNNPMDLMIEGEGFFKIRKADDSIAYTRDGSFKRSPDGRIINADGYTLEPDIVIPDDALELIMAPDGLVEVRLPGDNNLQEIGQIEMVRFTNPTGLRAIGKNLFIETDSSGPPLNGQPSLEGYGEINQGYLESSNVSVVEEMVKLIVAQRAYEISSKAIKTAEELLSLANNLKR
ncbi:MAG: flagellar basal-body rod protein FlgG, partial [Candidatus Electryonea clarkiae]|nr:flagellar basal-body rod protein FlgG [Candidatus Electryonea clarkiae]